MQPTFYSLNNRQVAPDLGWQSNFGIADNPVSAWRSFTGATSLSQATGASQPAYTGNVFNFLPGLTFDGSNDLLGYTGQAVAQVGAGTLWVVFKTPATINGPAVLVSQSDSAADDDYWELGLNAAGKLYIESNAGGTALNIEGATMLEASTVYEAMLAYDGVDYYLTLNQVEENPLVIASEGAFAWLGSVGGSPVFTLGATRLNSGTVRYFNGALGAVYFWNRDLTA